MCNLNKILIAISFLILILFSLQGVAVSQPIPFETIEQGETSYFNYGDPNFLGADMVIMDEQTWTWFWEQHTISLSPSPPPPKMNFRREMILAALLGYQTSEGGPSIEISSIEGIGQIHTGNRVTITGQGFPKGIRVFVKERREPGEKEVITNPYHLVKTKKFISVIFQHQPIDKPCNGNTDCLENGYCRKDPGNCDGAGICQSKPQACIQIYAPVCGCDGKTYGNECTAAMEGVSLLHEGPCGAESACMKNGDCGSSEFCLFPDGKCSGPGACSPKPVVCPMYCLPLCGCDMKTYCNQCEAYGNGISILSNGECEQECISSGGEIATGMCCNSVGDFPNTCNVGPCGCAPENSHLVNICDCGTDECFNGSICVPSQIK